MTGNQYTLTGSVFDGAIIFKYDLSGKFQSIEVLADLKDKQLAWFISHLPVREGLLNGVFFLIKNVKVQKVLTDLSFECFWSDYTQNIGKSK